MTAPAYAPSAPSPNGRHNEKLEAALAYVAAGIAVLPLHTPNADGTCSCNGIGCALDPGTGLFKGKHPRIPNGVAGASKDPKQIANWWSIWPDANVGVATGAASNGLVCIDFDNAALLQPWLDEIPLNADSALGDTSALAGSLAIQMTGRGYQVFFFDPQPGRNTKLAMNADGTTAIETRETGGYCMVAPSRHPNGQVYQWI